MDKAASLAFPLPKGTYRVRTNLFPAVREQLFTVAGKAATPWVVPAPTFGKAHVTLKNGRGEYVPGKVSFIGINPSLSPYLEPENPIVTGRGWESSKDSVYPPKDGLDVTLPAGTYLATASRGPEYTREARVIEVLETRLESLDFIIDKVVDTLGLISLDPHMHTQNSDGAVLIPERVRSVLVEGIEVLVSTDHNYITDYRADLDRLGLSNLMAVIVGEEVTARGGSIHYNSYPVVPRPNEPNNGAIGVEDDTPRILFNKSRTRDPGALIQVNHPRSRGLGYFLTYELDPVKAAAAKAPFNLDFDAMEVMNGAGLVEANRQSIEDWFHLLNRGYAIRAVGSSDAHGIDGGEPGYSRTYVLYNGPKGKGLDVNALLRAVKEGRSFVSNGPIVSVKVGKATFGDLVKAVNGRVDLAVKVTGAPWLDVSEVRVIVNGERKTVLPVKSPGLGTIKLDQKITLDLPRDAWIAVEVIGSKSLFPIVQQRSNSGKPENAVLPYALTNPILVDVDGNGRFDPVWPETVQIK